MEKRHKAIFLDRDGTINEDIGYAHKISQWRFLPRAIDGLAIFARAGWLLVVVSNQSGIGRGYYTHDDVTLLHDWAQKQLAAASIRIAAWKYCPHAPEAACQCRKPAPGLILEAASELSIALPHSWMLGDKISDVKAGLAAGCHAGLIASSLAEAEMAKHEFPKLPIWANLFEAATAITGIGAKEMRYKDISTQERL